MRSLSKVKRLKTLVFLRFSQKLSRKASRQVSRVVLLLSLIAGELPFC